MKLDRKIISWKNNRATLNQMVWTWSTKSQEGRWALLEAKARMLTHWVAMPDKVSSPALDLQMTCNNSLRNLGRRGWSSKKWKAWSIAMAPWARKKRPDSSMMFKSRIVVHKPSLMDMFMHGRVVRSSPVRKNQYHLAQYKSKRPLSSLAK